MVNETSATRPMEIDGTSQGGTLNQPSISQGGASDPPSINPTSNQEFQENVDVRDYEWLRQRTGSNRIIG